MRRDNLRLEERKKQMDKSKSHRQRQIELQVDWRLVKELTPAWRRLWQLLLSPSSEPKDKEESKR